MKEPKNKKSDKKRGTPFEDGRKGGFQPGVSGNPSGRPKNPFPALIREATGDGEEIVKKVLKVLRRSKSDKSIMWAAEWLRDTGWHKPVQGIRTTDEDGEDAPLQISYVRK